MSIVVDIIIIGGGPIGIACGIEAKKAGLEYIILEKGTLTNSLFNYPRNMTFFSTSELLEIGDIPFMSIKPKPSRDEALEYYRRVVLNWDLKLNLFEKVMTVSPGENGVYSVISNKKEYSCKNLIIATGFYDKPNLLNVKGETLPKTKHYYDDPSYYSFQKVIIVGANNSAVDAALETYRKGAEVTMIIREKEIGERVKYWVKPDIENRIKEGSIKAYFESEILEIEEHLVKIKTKEETITIENDWVLAMTGYQPSLHFLEEIGIKLSDDETKKPVYNEETHESNKPNIYLAGVVCGGLNTHSLFIENSRVHAKIIVDHILSKNQP